MNKVNLIGILSLYKILYSVIAKDNVNAVVVSKEIKDGTVVKFKNGSSITVIPDDSKPQRGNRAKLYPDGRWYK